MVSGFCALSCRYVRLGNYQEKPRGKVLTTESIIQMRVPRTGNKDDFVTVEIAMEDVLNVLAHLRPPLPILFLYISPRGCKKIREVLRMFDRLSHYLDIHNCQNNSQKRITIVMENIFNEDKELIKEQFGEKLHEIEYQNAHNIHLLSSPLASADKTNYFPVVLNVKRSFKTGDVVLTWHKTGDDFTAKICYSNLEVSKDPEADNWKTFKRTKLDRDSVLPSFAKYDNLRPGQAGYFRVRLEDDSFNEYFSNVASVLF